jgi:hypothetical protein
MRLTLRTLLAYMDDRLSPVQAKEIGQKVSKSAFAAELLERIREVKRKRRVASAIEETPMVDANHIAEYLDDQLTPELVARLEQKILASDSLLAEVASAHELLGMLRDPVPLEPRLRDRLYALRPTETGQAESGVPATAVRGESTGGATWKPPALAQSGRRRGTLLAVTVLAGIWLLSLLTDRSLFVSGPGSSPQVAGGAGALPGEEAVNAGEAEPEAGDKPAEAGPVADAGTDAGTQSGTGTEMAQATPAGPDVPGAESSVAGVGGNAPLAAQSVTPETVAGGEPTTGVGTPIVMSEPPAEGATDVPPAEPLATPAFLQADSRTVLVAEPRTATWTTLNQIPGGDTIVPEMNVVNCASFLKSQWFAVADPFELKLRIEGAGWLARVPGSAVLRLPETPRQGLSLLSGRLILTPDTAAAWQDAQRPVFDLHTGLSVTRIVLNSAETRIAIQVTPRRAETSIAPPETPPVDATGEPSGAALPPAVSGAVPAVANSTGVGLAAGEGGDVVRAERAQGTGPGAALLIPETSDLQVQLTVLEGSASLSRPQTGEPGALEIAAGSTVEWSVVEAREPSSPRLQPSTPATIPQWMLQPDSEPIPEVLAVRKRLIDALAAPGSPAQLVSTLVRDRNPQVAIPAVEVLALTGDVEQLLAALFEPLDETVHRAAIAGLRAIATGSASGFSRIEQALATRLPMSEAEFVMQLLQGLNRTQAAVPATTTALMQLLADERLALRTIAIEQIESLTGERHNYYPAAEPARRRDAIRRLQKVIDRQKGALLP